MNGGFVLRSTMPPLADTACEAATGICPPARNIAAAPAGQPGAIACIETADEAQHGSERRRDGRLRRVHSPRKGSQLPTIVLSHRQDGISDFLERITLGAPSSNACSIMGEVLAS